MLFALCVTSGASNETLAGVIGKVQTMQQQGKSRSEIAQYIMETVDKRIISLNRDEPDEKGSLPAQQYNMYKEAFDAWSDAGVDVDDPYASAHWAWQNGIGHCQENAHTTYHILMMSVESGARIGEFACGDHVYVIWGIPEDFTGKVTIDVINSWDNAYVIDPWLGICKPCRDVGRLDLYLTKGGMYDITRVATWSYQNYGMKYAMWLDAFEDFSGSYGTETDKLIVTQVTGASNVQVGQTMNTKPAGVFKVTQANNEVTVQYRAAKISGTAVGRLAILSDVESGNLAYVTLTKIKIGGTWKLKVLMKTVDPGKGTVIVREGLLTQN
jgi:hypothetical protein